MAWSVERVILRQQLVAYFNLLQSNWQHGQSSKLELVLASADSGSFKACQKMAS
jgi:hypothetical protein